ncbi:helix-turn-helix transcriptional regulator [Herbiconiux sp. 11R-BC]|uniref:helix-turn-helix domain-containing protein n=1 Tax=Herbiconiux sp. 11R-BC TaxID=3111637 RepID=UPI003C02C725
MSRPLADQPAPVRDEPARPALVRPVPVHPAPAERLWRELVGEELRESRLARGESLRTVAGRARVSPQYLSEIERGFKEPSSEILAALGGALERSLLDLTSGVAERLQSRAGASSPAASTNAVSVTAGAFALAA